MQYEGFENEFHSGNIHMYCGDCMDLMRQTPDKHFSLACVDPPYGLGLKTVSRPSEGNTNSQQRFYDDLILKRWDNEKPSLEYWGEIFRVSKNQQVFGGNYFHCQLVAVLWFGIK